MNYSIKEMLCQALGLGFTVGMVGPCTFVPNLVLIGVGVVVLSA